jgi:hypothetical protein
MSGEPQPGGPDRLDRAVFALKTVWFGLFSGGLVITVMEVAVVFSNDQPMADLGELAYLFLLAVPAGLVGAFILAPMIAPKDPAAVFRSASAKANPMYDGWDGTKPDDPYYWYPLYAAGFFVRAGMLEGTAILCAMGFLVTSNWIVLGGALLLIAALVAQIPTRSAVEAFAENARQRQTGI